MGKLLRVLVVIFLALSIGSLVLGIMLFNKREILQGRTHKLETSIKALGLTVESEAAESRPAAYQGRDTSPCSAQPIDTPEISTFWDTYKAHLEDQDLPKIDVSKREDELRSYYKIDAVTLKPARDARGRRITEGPGTMQQVLDDLQAKAGAQYDRLNETRQQLADLRAELVRTIEELNGRKRDLREALRTIEQLRAEIARLQEEIRGLKEQIARLEEEKRLLQDEVAEKNRKIQEMQEQLDDKDAIIAGLEEKLATKPVEPTRGPVPMTEEGEIAVPVRADLPHGEKGSVAAVEAGWNFLVLDLDPKFLRDLLGEDLSQPLPAIELFIKRAGGGQEFVTKVRLIQVRRDKNIGVADMLPGWTQLEPRKGDVVFY